MNTKKSIIIIVALIVPLSTAFAVDNPFGFETQKHPSEYGYCELNETRPERKDNFYECTTAPKPHPSIDIYGLNFVDGIGLCSIRARGPNHFADTIAYQIAKKYGESSDSETAPDKSYVWYLGNGPVGDITHISIREGRLGHKYTGDKVTWAQFSTKHGVQCINEIQKQRQTYDDELKKKEIEKLEGAPGADSF